MSKKWLLILTLCTLPQIALATPEYDACYKKAETDEQVALCMRTETTRLLKKLQETYLDVSKHPDTASWNKGNALITGNLKDMYDHWLAYRNRYCSLFTKAAKNTFGSEEFHKERCLLRLTIDHLELMDQILIDASGGSEEDDED